MNHSSTLNRTASSAHLEEALNLSSDGILVYEAVRDEAGSIVDYTLVALNDAAVRIFGMAREAVTGQRITQLWPGIAQDEIWPHCESVVNTRLPYQQEAQRTTPAGETLWFDVSLRPYGDGFANSFRDITAHKEALLESEAQKEFYEELMLQSISRQVVLQPLFNASGEVTDFRYEYLNYGEGKDDSHRHISVQKAPKPGMLVSEYAPSIKSNPVWEFYCGIVKTGVAARTEVTYAADGIDVMVDVSGKRLHDGRLLIAYMDISHTRRMADELAKEKSRLKGVLENVPLGITVFESVRDDAGELKDLRLVRRNEKALQMSRIPADKYKPGALISELMPDELSRFTEVMLQIVRTGEPLEHELYQPHLDGWIYSRVIRYGDGLLGTIQDITASRRYAQELQQQRELLNTVLDSSPVAIVVYEAVRNSEGDIEDFRPIIVNRHALQISGSTTEQFMATSFLQRDPGQREALMDQMRQMLAEQVTSRYEHVVPATGRWVQSITTPFRDGFIATSVDITEQKERDRIIQEQAELFNGVMDSLQNGLTILKIIRDESGDLYDLEYIDVARSVERDSGITREETRGRRMRDRFPNIEQTDYWKAFKKVVESGRPEHFETHFTQAGYDNYLLNWISPLGSDKLVSVYYIINDLKRAQKELEHTISELRRSNDDLEQFASVASHDLQEPLRKVQSFGNMLEARFADKLGDDGKDLVRRMQNAAGRMRDLVTGLLDFASLSRGRNDRLKKVDTDQLLKEIIFDLDHTLDMAGGRVQVEGNLPPVMGIQGQLRHLFHNLLTNAIKFRKPDVHPLIGIRAIPLTPADAAHLSPFADLSQYVRIDVTDNGIGFDPVYADKIFGLFERLHGLSQYQGTGIGLSICRRVAERHNGAIWAEGRPGEGARFSVLLPLSSAEA